MSEENKYHPAVEATMYTSGENMGLPKNTPELRRVADNVDFFLGHGESMDSDIVERQHERGLRFNAAMEAVKESGIANFIAEIGLGNVERTDEEILEIVKLCGQVGQEAAEHFDGFQSDAKLSKAQRELTEARARITELEAKK